MEKYEEHREKKIFTFGLCLCLALANVITALARWRAGTG